MLDTGKEKLEEHRQQNIEAPKSSKAFNRIAKVGLILYVLIIALTVTIQLSEETDKVAEITNVIFILSPLLFNKFLKERYEYLLTKEEYYNPSKSEKEIDFESKSLTFLLSATAMFPMLAYLIMISLGNINIIIFFVVLISLTLIASLFYYFFIYDMFPTDESKGK